MSNKIASDLITISGVTGYIDANGTAQLKLENVARGLGFTTVATSGNECIRWQRVEGYLKEFGFSQPVGKETYIPENIFYRLAFKANNKIAVDFQCKVADEILPEIRKHGAYVGENADKDYVNTALKFVTGKAVFSTFANADASQIKKLYDEFSAYIDDKYKYDTSLRIQRYKSAEKGVDRLTEALAQDVMANIGSCYSVQQIKQKVILDRTKIEKKKLGGTKGSKTKTIKKLTDQIDNICPPMDKYNRIDYHGFSYNYMFRDINKVKKIKTDDYKKWIEEFPIDDVVNDADTDTDKPIELYLKFVCKSKFDTDNLIKSAQDMIITNALGIDDNQVKSVHAEIIGNCNSYDDGKIYYYIRNVA